MVVVLDVSSKVAAKQFKQAGLVMPIGPSEDPKLEIFKPNICTYYIYIYY